MIKMKPILTEFMRSKQLRKPLFFNALVRGKFTSAYHKMLDEQNIFRGIRGSSAYPYWVVSPSKSYRTSKNTNNFYTGLIDKLPSWSDYPKRSKSIICSTKDWAAKSFGNVLRVFPQNGAKIGICNNNDFWESFPVVKRRIKLYSMDDFNSLFTNIFADTSKELGKMSRDLTGEIYDSFMETLNNWVSKSRMIEQLKTSDYFTEKLRNIVVDDVEENFKGDWEEYFDTLLNPVDNGFKLQTIETYYTESQDGLEIWTDAVSLMISDTYAQELLQSPTGLKPLRKPGDPDLDITI